MQADEQVPGTVASDAAVGDTAGGPLHGDPGEGHTSKTVDQSLAALRMLAVADGRARDRPGGERRTGAA